MYSRLLSVVCIAGCGPTQIFLFFFFSRYFLMYRLWEGELGMGKSGKTRLFMHLLYCLFYNVCFFFKKTIDYKLKKGYILASYSGKSFYSLYAWYLRKERERERILC